MARMGKKNVRPNPLVGAVLVHQNNIIGEGFHEVYGHAHAEINCLKSVSENNKHLITDSILYVSLEPCNHFGKTPPCVEAILQANIKTVVIGSLDCNPKMSGQSVKKLREHGVKVICPILEKECIELNKIFFTLQTKKRPYILLKWAESEDGFIGKEDVQVSISNLKSRIVVHSLRAQVDGVLVGYNTALIDNPRLTIRLVIGENPIRILIDWENSAKSQWHLLDQSVPTLIFNRDKNDVKGQIEFVAIEKDVAQLLQHLYLRNIYYLLIEGGAKTIQRFLDSNSWDEAIRILSPINLEDGISAPIIKQNTFLKAEPFGDDVHFTYSNSSFLS